MSVMIISFLQQCDCFLPVPLKQPVSTSMARSWSSKGFSISSSSRRNKKFGRFTTLAQTSGDHHTQDGQEEVGVPDVLRDVVLEEIKNLGGGRVKEVR